MENKLSGALIPVWGIMAFYVVVFFLAVFFTKTWIHIARRTKLTGKDMNKFIDKQVAEAGGIAVIVVFAISVLAYVFAKTFIFHTETHLVEVFALLLSIMLAGFIGFVDDVLGWKKGIKQWQKPLLTVPIAIPLAVINAGQSIMDLPFFGLVDLSVLYPLIVVPIKIIGASNAFNLLAGHNGLEALMGAIILATLGSVAFLSGQVWIYMIAFSMVATLLGFLTFNKYPSKVFPGDSLTYSIGALIAMIAILGSMEKLAIFLFIPYFLEFVLKLRSKFKAENFGIPQKDGTLKRPYKKIYSVTHMVMGKKATEKKVVFWIVLLEIVLCVIGVLFFA